MIVILGDAGINYFADWRDERLKNRLACCPITLFCIHGNHEIRPENIDTYQVQRFADGLCYVESVFPNILFAIDGQVYRFGDKNCLVIGGAYSVDKQYRLQNGYKWFSDEQPTDATKRYVEDVIERRDDINVILTHTCPYKYLPSEMFLPMIDQSTVDKSTEKWFDCIEDRVAYDRWYCGHYHTDKQTDKIRFMLNDIELLANI